MARRFVHTLWAARCGEPWLVATRRSVVELKHIAGFVSDFYDVPCWILSVDRDDPEGNTRCVVEMIGQMAEHLPSGFVADLPPWTTKASKAASPAEAGSDR